MQHEAPWKAHQEQLLGFQAYKQFLTHFPAAFPTIAPIFYSGAAASKN